MDIRGRTQGEEGLAITEQFLNQEQTTRNHVGISPHAPQTCSQELYRGAALLAKKHDISFCTHLAESEEEMEMFTQGSGPLFDFLKHFGRDMSDCGFQTPVQALLKNDLLPHGSLLVHMNFLNAEDRALLASRGADFFVIHCPKTHQFFKRPPFDWKFFYEHDYPLLLGTDSLASNNSLNLFEEMRAMAATAPELAPEEILTMVTLSPAAAFGMKGQLGELSCGALSEMIAIPFEGKLQDVVEAVVDNGVQPMVI
ncbi:MAG: amidohydrolase family protein [Chthoniobacterales bacterium]